MPASAIKANVQKFSRALARHRSCRLYLLRNSGLPDNPCNLSLAQAFARTAGINLIHEYASLTAQQAPENSPEEYLSYCGVLGLGRLMIEGKENAGEPLRKAASDRRWRIRKAVKEALQMIGEHDFGQLLAIGSEWIDGNPYVQRAVITSVCKRKLLRDRRYANQVVQLLDQAMNTIRESRPSTPGYTLLKKALGYCWSRVLVAYPEEGTPEFERWLFSNHPGIRWIVKKNLKKKRLVKSQPHWVMQCRHKINNVEGEFI